MITNELYFEPGQSFPPKPEIERIEAYTRYNQLYNTDFESQNQVWERLTEHTGVNTPPMVMFNYYKTISLKIADLILQESPKLIADSKIQEVAEFCDLESLMYRSVIDMSKYGNAILMATIKDGKGYIRSVDPLCWYPIVSNYDQNEVIAHVLAWVTGNEKEGYVMHIQRHYVGEYIEQTYGYSLKGGILKQLSNTRIATGLESFAIVPISVPTQQGPIGASEYTTIDNLVEELNEKVALVGNILDRHSNPVLSGPQLAINADNSDKFNRHQYFATDNLEAPFQYLTWDAQLTNVQAHIKLIQEQIAIISEMGPALLPQDSGGNLSAKAIRLQYIAPLSKAARYKKALNRGVVKALCLACNMQGLKFTSKDVVLEFQDGLPVDYNDDVDAEATRLESGTTTLVDAIARLDNCTREEAQEKYTLIQAEKNSPSTS